MRFAARTDANHAAIVGGLRACGAKVVSLAAVGKGVPDILVWHPASGKLLLMEIKDGRKVASARKLTPDQVAFHAEWPVTVVTSVEEAIGVLSRGGT